MQLVLGFIYSEEYFIFRNFFLDHKKNCKKMQNQEQEPTKISCHKGELFQDVV